MADKTLYLNTEKPETRRQIYEVIRTLEAGRYTLDLIRTRWRVGDGQRGYYWGYVVVEVGKLIDEGREQTDRVLNALFLSVPYTVAGVTLTIVRSLSDLDAAGATDYFEQISGWVYDTYGTRLDPPGSSKAPKGASE